MANTATEHVNVDTLYPGALGVKPVSIDWEAMSYPGEGRWSYAEHVDVWVDRDDTYRDVIVRDGYTAALYVDGETFESDDFERYAESLPDGLSEEQFDAVFAGIADSDGPMTNFWYPYDFRDDLVEAAAKIAHLPLAVVEVEGAKGLALTGAGMDFSWEICEAFVRLGFLPPTHFARLPGMAGRGESARDKVIIAACKRAFRVAQKNLQYDLDSLTRLYPDEPSNDAEYQCPFGCSFEASTADEMNEHLDAAHPDES